MLPALAIIGLCLIGLAYVLFLKLAHSPAGALRFIESSIALRKKLAAGGGGRIAIATLGSALLAAALASAVTLPLAATLAALLLAIIAAGLHRFTNALAVASCGRIAQAESKVPGSGPLLARRVAFILASAALGAGTLAAALILLAARSFIGPEAAGAVSASFLLLYPAAAHLSARPIDATPLRENSSRLAGLLAALACSAASFSALVLISPGCPLAGAPSILAAGFGAALVACLALLLVAHRILLVIARAANP